MDIELSIAIHNPLLPLPSYPSLQGRSKAVGIACFYDHTLHTYTVLKEPVQTILLHNPLSAMYIILQLAIRFHPCYPLPFFPLGNTRCSCVASNL